MPAFDFVLAGRYRLVAPLGEGGMAAVYRARDLRLNREVAIKVLHDDLNRDPEFLDRFQREAQFVASLSHPHIVPVYDVGEERGTHFIVMEYVRGRTLKEVIERDERLPESRAVPIAVSVLEALAYAHEHGLIHRDVKPQNILISPDGTPRLADFGIARLADGSTSRTAAILGSAHYLSPEQSRGENATVQSDVYASGVVLYEMLTGTPPFDGPNALAIANQHLSADPPPLRSRAPDVSPSVEKAVSRALCKSASDRFEDANSFASALTTESHDLSGTVVQPLDAERTSVALPPASGARPARPAPRSGMVVRRSARKSFVAAASIAVLLIAAARLAAIKVNGQGLPDYPSAPYLLVPLLLIAAVVIFFLNSRSWVYSMDDDAAVVQWGLVGHHRFGVPLRQIATLELKQSPLDRLLGVGTVELCAKDQHGEERRLVMEDLPRPSQTYEELTRLLGRALHRRSADGL